MNRIKIFLIIGYLIIVGGCSFDTRSGLWTNKERLSANDQIDNNIYQKKKIISDEFNINFILKTPINKSKSKFSYQYNDDNLFSLNKNLEKISRYKFSKIKHFDTFEPELVFDENSLIFFDKKGTIIKFNEKSKILWKKNFYDKKEKKNELILSLFSNGKYLIVTDSLANYYSLDINTGELLWKKSHNSVFISDIKIDKEIFYVIDSENEIHCFSIADGSKVWNFKTDNELIKSQKKLSIIYDENNIYFNNSMGTIYSLNKYNGQLIWLTPTLDNLDFQLFRLKTSKLVLNNNEIFFSNNFNNFFSMNKENGFINWSQNINSFLKPIIVNNLIFTISLEGYLHIINKENGNIIRISDVFDGFSQKKRKGISPTGFILTNKYIYLSTNIGKILKIDIGTGKSIASYNIDKKVISRPFINDESIFVIKDDSILKMN